MGTRIREDFMLRLRLAFVVGILGFLPVIAAAQPTPTACSTCPVRTVPEPATITLVASGLGVLALVRGRMKKKK